MQLREKANRFRGLHVPGRPFVLFNIWDAGSAKVVADAGAAALATGSWSVAAAHGFEDGEQLPLSLALDNARRIAGSTDLPVSLDVESGYGTDAATVGHTIGLAAGTGVVGFNLEDSVPGSGTLHSREAQVARIRSARQAADEAAKGLFLNARTDVFLSTSGDDCDDARLNETVARGHAYADAGADGLFVPGLVAPEIIERLVRAVSLPVNVMIVNAAQSHGELASLGVARISYGPMPYALAMRALSDAARRALDMAE